MVKLIESKSGKSRSRKQISKWARFFVPASEVKTLLRTDTYHYATYIIESRASQRAASAELNGRTVLALALKARKRVRTTLKLMGTRGTATSKAESRARRSRVEGRTLRCNVKGGCNPGEEKEELQDKRRWPPQQPRVSKARNNRWLN